MSKRSIHIEDILEDCVTAIQEQEISIAECLIRYPDQRDELEPLLRLTAHLQSARVLQAPPEFRQVSAIRMRNLVAARPREMSSTAGKRALLQPTWQKLTSLLSAPRRLSATLVISVLLTLWLFIGGAVYASNRALPGDTLYPVKRGSETTQLAASWSDARDARLHLLFAGRRLDEANALLERNRFQEADEAGVSPVSEALADYETQVEAALTFINEESVLSAQQRLDLANLLMAELAHHENRLVALLDRAPQYAHPAIEVALITAQTGRERALSLLSGSGAEVAGINPTATPTFTRTPVPPTPSPQASTATPSSTPLPPSPTPTASPLRTRATSSPTTPVWQSPAYWPEGCPTPPDWPAEWPETCQVPREWLEWWSYWPENCTIPAEWPLDQPEACPLPPEWLEEWWTHWPEDCPLPPEWPSEWPAACSEPPEWLEWWRHWREECRLVPGWPPEWPDACPVPTIVVPTVSTIIVPTIVVPTIVVPTIVVPTVEVPTVEVPTVEVPTVEVPTVVVPTVPVPGLP